MGIKLLYIWNGNFGNSSLYNKGFIINSKYYVEYNHNNGTIYIEKNENYIPDFWGNSITDCFAIVGENGTGKTMVMNLLMDLCSAIKGKGKPGYKCFFIFEDEESEKIYLNFFGIIPPEENKINIKVPYEINKEKIDDLFDNFHIAYFHNLLNRKDYFSKDRCIYDFSIGQMINYSAKVVSDMKYDGLSKDKAINYFNYDGLSEDKIINYFNNEDFKLVEFLYTYVADKSEDIPFVIPKKIYIEIVDESHNTDFLINEAKKIKWGVNEKNALSKVDEYCGKLTTFFKQTESGWIINTIRQLLMNCFKTIIFPSVATNNINIEYAESFNKMAGQLCLKAKEGLEQYKIYDLLLEELEKLDEDIDKGPTIGATKRFIEWLRNNESFIMEIENMGRIEVDTDKDKENFMKDLVELYVPVCLAFPFYIFSFNLSAGEYNFLSLFSNLYYMKKEENTAWHNVFAYPAIEKNSSILLIFDEAELSMHPRWQREYMKWILQFCDAFFKEESVQIIVTTHSPILLSDFPSQNVLYLKKDKEGLLDTNYNWRKTFGNNIHTIYLNSFFLDDQGTMGAFAEQKINGIARQLSNSTDIQEDQDQLKKEIEFIGEGIVRTKLLELYYEKTGKHIKDDNMRVSNKNEAIEKTIEILKQQKKNLEEMIDKLEAQND